MSRIVTLSATFGLLVAGIAAPVAVWLATVGLWRWFPVVAAGFCLLLLVSYSLALKRLQLAVGTLVLANILAVVAFVAGWVLSFWIAIDAELCGNGLWPTWGGPSLGAAAYIAIGGWSFHGRKRLLWGWPAAILVGLGIWLAIRAVVPGGHGYCET